MKVFWISVITALIWGSTPILEKIGLSKGINPMMAVVIRTAGCFMAAGIFFIFLSRKAGNFSNIDFNSSLLLMIAGAAASVGAQILFYIALQSGDVSKVMPITGSFPMVSFILGIVLLGEAVTVPKLIGAVLVVAGVMFLQ